VGRRICRPGESGDPARDPRLEARGPARLFLEDRGVVREFDRQRDERGTS
jgi:hypothetical protein